MSTYDRNPEILSLPIAKQLRQAKREDSHPIPEFRIPENWERNEPMCNPERTEIGLRRTDFECFIELHSVGPLADIDGPYYAEGLEHIGGSESLETRLVRRLTGIEPGEVQEAVLCLVFCLSDCGRRPTLCDGGGQEIRDEIREQLEPVGKAGMDPVILAAQMKSTLNETVDVLESMVEDGDVECFQHRSYKPRYRLAEIPQEVQ